MSWEDKWYIVRCNGVLESHSRSLHSTQCDTEDIMVNSEGLKKSQPGVGKLTVQHIFLGYKEA